MNPVTFRPTHQILALHDDTGICVYQAFCPEVVEAALAKGTFGKGFNLERMTWIKPSFGWMLHRSGCATKHNQDRILRIRLSHEGFRTILSRGLPTSYNERLFATQDDWHSALDRGDVRYQWDPDRDLVGRPLPHRAIQLGIRGETVRQYVNEWILGLEDMTELAHQIAAARKGKGLMPQGPLERVYPVEPELARGMGMLE